MQEIWRLRFPVIPCPELETVARLYHQYQVLTHAAKGETSKGHSPQAERLAEKIHTASLAFARTQAVS